MNAPALYVVATSLTAPCLPRPALRATANVIKNNSLLFAAVGGTFAAGTHIAECQRGKDDVFNGASLWAMTYWR